MKTSMEKFKSKKTLTQSRGRGGGVEQPVLKGITNVEIFSQSS